MAVYQVLIVGEYNYECEPCDYTSSLKGLLLLRLTYYYFLFKVMDLFDTVWKIYINFMSKSIACIIDFSFLLSCEKKIHIYRSYIVIIIFSCALEHI